MMPNIKDRSGALLPSNTLRKTLDRLFSFLALIAVLFNFLAPVTHGFMASAEAGEYVEICTKNGIELLPINSATNEITDTNLHAECNTCPLCQIGKGQLLAVPNIRVFDSRYLLIANIRSRQNENVSLLSFRKYDLAPRAPPIS